MAVTEKQLGVLKGMVGGTAVLVPLLVLSVYWNPFQIEVKAAPVERLLLAFRCGMVPGIFLVISVGRMAGQRFFNPDDIDGLGLTTGTERAKVLQAILQNTLEQSVLAIVAYLAWAAVMPDAYLSAIPMAALVWAVGRILFFFGYARGATARALGFALTFYSSALILCVAALHLAFLSIQ
jgi:hypothetical protein